MKTKLTITVLALVMTSNLAIAAQGPSTKLDAVLMNTDPQPVESGEDAEIRFKIMNTGDTETGNAMVEIIDSYPFELKPDTQRNYSLGSITPGREYHITSEVLVTEDAPDGQNSFQVRIRDGDFSRTVEIPVTVQSEQIELDLANLQSAPSNLMPNTEDNKMTLEVVNNGEKTAENVVLNLELPEEFEKTSSFSTRQALGNIDDGEVKEAEFNFDISENASMGMKQVPARISYSSGDNTEEIDEETGFSTFVSGKPQYEIVSVSSDLSTDSSGQIRINIRNKGSEKSENTRVRVLENSDLPFSFDSSNNFLGSLKAGAEGTVVFETTVEDDAVPKEYLLDLEIRGVRDSEVFVDQKVKDVEVKGSSGSSQNFPIFPVISMLAGGLIGAGTYRYRNRITPGG